MKKGDKVKMTEDFKKALMKNESADHIKEFGDCVGIVEGLCYPDSSCDDVDVRWIPSGLRYGYLPENLVKIK